MYLRRLEVLGFKSFRNRVVVEFDPGITVIVGPNGSGKSNLVDGLRWVLGEQSARSMRGDKMEDLLFAGSSDSRATGMAEVTAVLEGEIRWHGTEESDCGEIAITRRLYRSGESEYLINQKKAHLREIQELLWDVGISKDGFSIITQGKVDEVLGAKPEDRRLLLEVAAGVYKHKKRKEAALRELEQVNASETRLHDIISELSGQAEPLRQEAEVAKQYRSLGKELARKRLQLGAARLMQLGVSVQGLQEKVRSLESKLEQSALVGDRAIRDHEEEKRKLEEAEEAWSQVNDRLHQLEVETEKANSRVREYQAAVGSEEKFLQDRDQNYQGLKHRLQKVESQIKSTEARIQDLEEKGARVDHGEASILTSLGGIEARLKETEKEAKSATSELLEASNRLAQARHSVAQVEQRKSFLASRVSKLNIEIQAAEKRKQELAGKVGELVKTSEQAKEELSRLKGQLVQVMNEREEVRHTLTVGKQSYQAGQEMLKNQEGKIKYLEATLNSGTQAVIKGAQKQVLKGILGTVADLLSVDSRYAVAIGAALSNMAENVVTNTVEDAKQAIKFLKANRAGWATFIPLERLPSGLDTKVDPAVANLQKQGSIIDLACNLVTVDSQFLGLRRYALHNVLVVSDIDEAHRVAHALRYRYKVVTLEGDIIYPGGTLRGGSKAKASSILARRAELRRLLLELSRVRERAAAEEKACRTAEEKLAELERQASQLEKRKLGLESELAQAERLKVAYQEELRPLVQRLEEKRLEASEIGVALQQQKEEIATAKSSLRELEAQLADWEGRVNDLQAQVEGLRKDREKLADQKARLEVERQVTLERLGADREALAKLQREKGSLQGEIAEWAARLDATRVSLEQNRQQLKLAQDQVADLANQRQSLEQEAKARQEHLRACQKLCEEAWRQKSKIDHHLAKQRERLQLESIKLTEAKATYMAESRNLCSQFNISEEELIQVAAEATTTQAELERDIADLMAAIEALGPVDESTIGELSKLTERLEFLQAQLDDIVSSKSDLMELVGEMDNYMKQRFRATFERINREFKDIFLRLIGGGQAELRWADPDDPLSSGLEILVQLPGKKLQNLLLLSGGERALCSLALMLALVQVQESPFCVLDEVDSSLDGANLERFLGLAQEMADHTQLILISHRQPTMQIANYLYGVTMERPGISKLLSVRLKEGLEDEPTRTLSNFPA